MSRYIDADALIQLGLQDGAYEYVSVQEIADFPTADVVEVVRCKECKYLIEHHYEEDGEEPYVKYTCRWSGNYQRYLSDFCSYGERREDG